MPCFNHFGSIQILPFPLNFIHSGLTWVQYFKSFFWQEMNISQVVMGLVVTDVVEINFDNEYITLNVEFVLKWKVINFSQYFLSLFNICITYFIFIFHIWYSSNILQIQDEFLKIKPGLGNVASLGNISGIWTPDLYIYRLKSFKMR